MKELSVLRTWPQKLFISARLQVDSLKCKISSITWTAASETADLQTNLSFNSVTAAVKMHKTLSRHARPVEDRWRRSASPKISDLKKKSIQTFFLEITQSQSCCNRLNAFDLIFYQIPHDWLKVIEAKSPTHWTWLRYEILKWLRMTDFSRRHWLPCL